MLHFKYFILSVSLVVFISSCDSGPDPDQKYISAGKKASQELMKSLKGALVSAIADRPVPPLPRRSRGRRSDGARSTEGRHRRHRNQMEAGARRIPGTEGPFGCDRRCRPTELNGQLQPPRLTRNPRRPRCPRWCSRVEDMGPPNGTCVELGGGALRRAEPGRCQRGQPR